MAVNKGWVGSSAKAETGKAWMGDARVALRLPRAGWMSEMVGRSKEIRFVNNTNRTQANIYKLMGSPKEVTTYIFENNATISAATQGGWALQTGAFPKGSTLTIVNRGFIRGGGGNGGSLSTNGKKGGDALILNFPTHINNSQGYIYAGGGGGGGGALYSGGGGAGTPAGIGPNGASNGNATTGGAGDGGNSTTRGGRGGNLGLAGARGYGSSGPVSSGGAAGRAVVRNGHALSWLGGNGGTRVKGAVV